LITTDENGVDRSRLEEDILYFYKADGKLGAIYRDDAIYYYDNGGGTSFYDSNGILTATHGRGGTSFYDSNGILTATHGRGGSAFYDSNGAVVSRYSSSTAIVSIWLQVNGSETVTGTLYTASGTVSVSDENYKNSINPLEVEKSAVFIYSLTPCEFKYNDGTSGRFHHGFGARKTKSDMGADDWGLYVEENIVDEATKKETIKCGLRYEELIADLVGTVQSQNQRIKELESKVELLINS